MKRCPTCQKTFADTMKFCQIDGTPLVEDAPPPDPYKTIVGGSVKSDNILQLPETPDPLKTVVSRLETPKSSEPQKDSTPVDSPSSNTPPKIDSQTPVSPPKSDEPTLNPPSVGDSSPQSGSTSSGNTKPKSFDATFSSINPPSFLPGKDATSPFDKPSDVPFGSPLDSTKDEPPPTAIGGTPFDVPKPASSVPPPYKEPESFNAGGQLPYDSPPTPFGQSNDPFGASPQTPFGEQSNDPFGAPQFGGQGDWNPPPAPVSSWQDQGLGANTPFQPPMGTGAQNQTLAIVSLVTGILSICLCGIFAGIPALITGYMAKNNADNNPAEYGGRGMALAGMILGGVSVVLTILYVIYILAVGFGGIR
ncbi:MAG: DUF4190 domain-containing protein [Pyrinomonadaceae bacterium]